VRWLVNIVIAFVAYQFGRWVKQADLVLAHFNDRNEIERLRAQVAGLEAQVADLEDAVQHEREATFQ
jgi:hypothetical protein